MRREGWAALSHLLSQIFSMTTVVFLFEYLPFFVLHVIEHIKITLFDIILKNLCPFVKSKYIWLKGQEVTRGETDFIVTLFQAVKIVIQKRFNC